MKWLKQVKVCKKNKFPFLGMKVMWDEIGFLSFRVFYKEGQAIKYVDCSTFKAISSGVYLRLGRLTSKT
eukprot:59692-Ditylum_brightwellii.AAC.1